MNLGPNGSYQSEINITPLVDVVLVLLIIFMVIVPAMLYGYDVDVPGETLAPPPEEERVEQVILTIEWASCAVGEPPGAEGLPADCTVRINGDDVAVSDLPDRLGETFAGRKGADRVLFLAASDRLNYEGVMRILDIAKTAVPDLRIGLVKGDRA